MFFGILVVYESHEPPRMLESGYFQAPEQECIRLRSLLLRNLRWTQRNRPVSTAGPAWRKRLPGFWTYTRSGKCNVSITLTS